MIEIKIQGKDVHVHEVGLKLLKLKTELSTRIGADVVSGKDYLSFPISALHAVKDMLPENSSLDPKLKNLLYKSNQHEIARIEALQLLNGESRIDLPEYWQSVLDPAQITATAAMTVQNLMGLCLFDEQGSGKTVMTIAAFDILRDRGEVDAMIVVCPKSMISEWQKGINVFCPDKYNIVLSEGNRKQKYGAALRSFDVLVVNYEGVEPMLISLLAIASAKKFLLVIDESYYLKNSESIRSAHTLRLRSECQRCFVLCGTPAPNTAHDLINQFNLADQGFTFGAFKKSREAEADWDKISMLTESRGLFIRRLKKDILTHVPKKNFHILTIELTGKQKKMYESARSELELELRNLNNETFKRILATYFQKRAALLQICSCPSIIDPTLSETSAKYLILDDLLSRLIGQGRKVILWSFYKRSLDELSSRYEKYNPVRVDGSVSANLRKEAVSLFQESRETMLFLGNPAAAGAGITLHSSYDAVYISYSNQAAHFLQSLDRIHRRGQLSDQVHYYFLICKDTIEENEIFRLRSKEIMQHDLLGDKIEWPTSLDDALEELRTHD